MCRSPSSPTTRRPAGFRTRLGSRRAALVGDLPEHGDQIGAVEGILVVRQPAGVGERGHDARDAALRGYTHRVVEHLLLHVEHIQPSAGKIQPAAGMA